MNRGKLYCY